ncbi:sufurtransferase FdhD [Pseudodesulfovibrio sp. F-1]|uniref:Protein FdhD n=2 Tax=Pseudodesulfovibrio alkaliphilus TaxID=2661613 RepID=A0A7K1KLI9_9BACT|nr:sufurtransferase FdhD [Pseudodesulfovibrio alkaliphilus]
MPLRAFKCVGEAPRPEGIDGQPRPSLVCPRSLQRYAAGSLRLDEDMIAVEEDIRIRVQDHSEMVLARTPGDDLNLIAGHLFSRSMIRTPEDILNVAFHPRNGSLADVVLKSPKVIRRIFPSPHPLRLAPERIFEFKALFEHRQKLFKNTGATHAAALISVHGELLSYGEDVGRHNAFDKAIGRALLEGSLARAAIAMLSSRLALELTIKAATANIPILCGFSAATSSGIQFAEDNNITLIGRIRENTLAVYAHSWRLRAPRVD